MDLPLNDASPSFLAKVLRQGARTGDGIPLEILTRIATLLERIQPPDWAVLECEWAKDFSVARLGSDLLSRPRMAGTWNSAGLTRRRLERFLKGQQVSPTLATEFAGWLIADAQELERASVRISDALNKEPNG